MLYHIGEAVLLVRCVLCVTYFWLSSNSSKVKSDSPLLILLPRGVGSLHLIPLSNQHGTTTTCQTTKLNNCPSKAVFNFIRTSWNLMSELFQINSLYLYFPSCPFGGWNMAKSVSFSNLQKTTFSKYKDQFWRDLGTIFHVWLSKQG